METVVVIVAFAVCAAFVESKVETYRADSEVTYSTVSDEDFQRAVEVEKEWRKK